MYLLLSSESPQGGRFRFSSRCAFLAQRDALGVHASLVAEPSALRLSLGSFFVHWERRGNYRRLPFLVQ
jgi:hypothetical protein